MRLLIKAECKRVRRNNGIVEALFTRYPNSQNKQEQEHHILVNVKWEDGMFEQGKIYLIDISPILGHDAA
jgi:hypothetical protein